MSSGKLHHRITIETKTRTGDSGGGGSVAWTAVETVWADVTPISGFKRMQSEQMQARVTHKVTMRYRTDVDISMRLKWGTRLFSIRSAINDSERSVWLVLDCEELGAP